MCERNKYVPPSYEEVIPNNIVIDPVPNLQLPAPQTGTVAASTRCSVATVMVDSERPLGTSDYSSTSSLTDGESESSVSSTTDIERDAKQSAATSHSHHYSSAILGGSDATDAPPSYDEYHKYELYGSTLQLVWLSIVLDLDKSIFTFFTTKLLFIWREMTQVEHTAVIYEVPWRE